MGLDLNDIALLTQQNRELLKKLIAEFLALREMLADGLSISALPELPAPVVNVPQAPTHAPLDVSELAATLAPILAQTSAGTTERWEELTALIGKFAEEVKTAGSNVPQKVLGGQAGKIKDAKGVVVSPATEETVSALRRGLTDFESRLDYGARTDSNPVYVGKALAGSATSGGGWTIQKFTYDTSDRATRVQVVEGVWDDREGLF